MQAAPPVSVRGSGSGAWQRSCALLPLLVATVLAAWALAHLDVQGWQLAIAAGLSGLATVWLVSRILSTGHHLRPRSRGWAGVETELRWDGQQWHCGADTAVAPDVMIDLDGWLLLRLRPTDGSASRWMAITAAEAGVAWADLRAALFSTAPEAAGLAERSAEGLASGLASDGTRLLS